LESFFIHIRYLVKNTRTIHLRAIYFIWLRVISSPVQQWDSQVFTVREEKTHAKMTRNEMTHDEITCDEMGAMK
jgi:hypothetical protein